MSLRSQRAFLVFIFFFITFLIYSQPTKTYSELPALYQKAFSLGAQLDKSKLEVFLESKNGYFIYKDNLKISSPSYNLKEEKAPDAFKGLDPITKKIKEFYKDQNVFEFLATSKDNSDNSPHNLIISLQACSKENCLLPTQVSIPIKIIPSIDKATPYEGPRPNISTESQLATKIKNIITSSGGILSWQALLILFIAGLITAISPCVLPLFPLTLGIFSRWSHKNPEKAFGLSISYGLGIILFFAINGLISAATGSIFGSLTQNPYYLLTIGILTLLAGIFFSGLIPFPFANFLMNLVGTPASDKKEQSYFSLLTKSFFMGATLGLVASPCVGPILLALLAWLSTSLPQGDIQSYASGFMALSIFGLGLALPFLILGHFYFRLNKRIQLGKYSLIAKYAGSILLIIASLFFLVPAYKSLFSEKTVAKVEAFTWENRPQNKWLVVDFRADWCVACIEIENEVLSQASVMSFMKENSWSLVKVDLTDPKPYEHLATQYSILSLPSLIFLDPSGKECSSHRLNEKESPENFLNRLQSAQNNCQ